MSASDQPRDPIYESSRRELKWILVIWLVNCIWVVGYCGLFGYQADGQPLVTVWGMPSWVFWGIFVPWIVASGVSIWFALTQIEEHPLDETRSQEAGEHTDG